LLSIFLHFLNTKTKHAPHITIHTLILTEQTKSVKNKVYDDTFVNDNRTIVLELQEQGLGLILCNADRVPWLFSFYAYFAG
jgi:hypothetical protein